MLSRPSVPAAPARLNQDAVAEVAGAGSRLRSLRQEALRLEQELAAVEAAIARTERLTAPPSGGPGFEARSAAFITQLMTDELRAAQADARRAVEDGAGAAAERLAAAREQGHALVRAAQAELRDVHRAHVRANTPEVGIIELWARGGDGHRTGVERDDREGRDEEAAGAGGSASGGAGAFGAFWREQERAATAFRRALAPFEVLVPMLACVIVLAIVLLLVG